MLHWKTRIYGLATTLLIIAAYGGGMTWRL
jgi:hypothetical protein